MVSVSSEVAAPALAVQSYPVKADPVAAPANEVCAWLCGCWSFPLPYALSLSLSPSPLHCPVPLSSCRCTACLPRWFVSSCCHLQQRPPSLSGCCDKPQSHAYKPLLSEKAVKTTMAKRNDTIQVFPSWTTIFVIHN